MSAAVKLTADDVDSLWGISIWWARQVAVYGHDVAGRHAQGAAFGAAQMLATVLGRDLDEVRDEIARRIEADK